MGTTGGSTDSPCTPSSHVLLYPESSPGSVTSCCSAQTEGGAMACWVCLDEGDSSERGQLIAPCSCARTAHRWCHSRCLARWQLQSAGTRRETHCDFCGDRLPDWRSALTPTCGAAAPAIMNVNFGGTTYSFQVKPGPEGYAEFTQAICRAFALPQDAELNITFTCDEPSSGEASDPDADGSLLTLQGAGAYDAAVHCASVSAARRSTWQLPARRSTSEPTSSTSTSSLGSSAASSRSSSLPSTPRGGSSGGLGRYHGPRMRRGSLHDGEATTTARRPGEDEGDGAAGGGSGKGSMLVGLGNRIRTALSELFQ